MLQRSGHQPWIFGLGTWLSHAHAYGQSCPPFISYMQQPNIPAGRPADLNPRRISPGHALSLLDSLKQQLGDKLQMHTVGFGKEQTWWLDMIAASAFGRFHE